METLQASEKLEAAINDEIGADDGREMPDLKGITWTLKSKSGDTILDSSAARFLICKGVPPVCALSLLADPHELGCPHRLGGVPPDDENRTVLLFVFAAGARLAYSSTQLDGW